LNSLELVDQLHRAFPAWPEGRLDPIALVRIDARWDVGCVGVDVAVRVGVLVEKLVGVECSVGVTV
jgi:hypothetical protein